ncbi:MAG: hypothetical protein GX649_00025, partial [Chloroflexi bacterium]|nr:hypothetical protein [Chloroflexota bacterium]
MTNLYRYNPVDIELALREAQPFTPFPRIADRVAWEAIAARLGPEKVREYINQAEAVASQPVPGLPATLWLEFQRIGRREGFQEPRGERRRMLTALTLAECLEDQGRFLDPLLDVAWAICEESSWDLPAHQAELTDLDHPVIDLGAAGTGIDLAECDYLVGERLDPLLGKRIRDEVDRRLFTPYLTRHDHWWLYNTALRRVNNWTAVCNAGVLGAALYLEEDLARLAEIIARGARSLDDYMDTFDPDGGSSEGPGYWGYGFGNYAVISQLVEAATGGRITFMGSEHAARAAEFPLKAMLNQGSYANFSDCDPTVVYPRPLLVYLSQRLGNPALMQLARMQPEGARAAEMHWALRALAWPVEEEPAGAFVPAKRDWFGGMMWMFARFDPADPDALVVAAKGGHNGEMHNQNDVGSLIVRVQDESVLCELGRGRYTKAYFSPQRYEHFVNSSLGHPVPVPNGQAQLPGEEYAAELVGRVVDDRLDAMTIEMRGAYPAEADLTSLRRTVVLHREAPAGWVEVSDEVAFASAPGTLDSVLFTFGSVELGEGQVLVRGERGAVRISYDASIVSADVEHVTDLDLSVGPSEAERLVFSLRRPTQQGVIRLRIDPVQ